MDKKEERRKNIEKLRESLEVRDRMWHEELREEFMQDNNISEEIMRKWEEEYKEPADPPNWYIIAHDSQEEE